MVKAITDTDCCRGDERLEQLAQLLELAGNKVERLRIQYFGDSQSYYRLLVNGSYID